MAGLNEDLAATALWGAQQAELRGEGKFDGVFGVWYGKGPGLDRTGDVFRHANHAGTSKHGGVLALMGDDHTCESSTSAHQSEFAFVDYMMPVLNPAGVQEILDYGMLGFALSRFAGVWVGLKCVKDNIEATATVDGRIDRIHFKIPDDFVMPPDGLNIRLGDQALDKEARLHDYKRAAILAFARANKLDRLVTSGGPAAEDRHHHLRQELSRRAPGDGRAGHRRGQGQPAGAAIYKVGMTWPLEPQGVEVRGRARPDPRGRGKARADRDAGQGAAVRPARTRRACSARRTRTSSGCSRPSTRSTRTTSPSRSASG